MSMKCFTKYLLISRVATSALFVYVQFTTYRILLPLHLQWHHGSRGKQWDPYQDITLALKGHVKDGYQVKLLQTADSVILFVQITELSPDVSPVLSWLWVIRGWSILQHNSDWQRQSARFGWKQFKGCLLCDIPEGKGELTYGHVTSTHGVQISSPWPSVSAC